MKRNRLLSLIIIIFFQFTLNLATADENYIKGVKLLELSQLELTKLNISITDNYVSYPEYYLNDKYDSNIKTDEVFIYNMQIDIRNRVNEKNPELKLPIPRFTVNQFENGSTAYFRILKDYKPIMFYDGKDIRSSPDSAVYFYAEANSLIGIHIKFDNPKADVKHNDIYLWYEPTDEFINRLPETYQKELRGEIDPVSEKTDEGYTDDWREISDFISDCMVYPNPATSGFSNIKFNLKEARTLDITLHDISGKQIINVATGQYFTVGEQMFRLELNNIPAGMYLISIKSDKGESVVQRMIVTQ